MRIGALISDLSTQQARPPYQVAVERVQTEGLLGLADFQPSQENVSLRFRERP